MEQQMAKPLTYKDAGVDIDKANAFVTTIKNLAGQTDGTGVIGGIGGFGGFYALDTETYKTPVLVSSTDGVGTKLKLAFMTGIHNTVGIDLVAMCVNDIAVTGAKPLFFLDYLSIGKLDTDTAAAILTGITEGCKQAGCALIGGETAEMPDMYAEGEYDLAGFSVGVVNREDIIDGSAISEDNILLGIPSSGVHSNGFSLVRKICFDVLNLKADSYIDEFGKTIGEVLLTPTIIYAKLVQTVIAHFKVNGIAHITGGGLTDNIIRIVPEKLSITINKGSWPVPPIFGFLQKAGQVPEDDMAKTFNNGIGLVMAINEKDVDGITDFLRTMNITSHVIGRVRKNDEKTSRVVYE